MKRLPLSAEILLLGWVISGCSPRDNQFAMQEHILDALPLVQFHERRIDFGGKCSVEGFWIEPADFVHPGQSVDISVYWYSRRFFKEAYWYLFADLLDQDGRLIDNLDPIGPLRETVNVGVNDQFDRSYFPGGRCRLQLLGPSQWMPGKIYEDRIQFTIPSQGNFSEVQIAVGIWNGQTRLRVTEGPVIGQDAGLVAKLLVSRGTVSK